jgi:hypothetical protein
MKSIGCRTLWARRIRSNLVDIFLPQQFNANSEGEERTKASLKGCHNPCHLSRLPAGYCARKKEKRNRGDLKTGS